MQVHCCYCCCHSPYADLWRLRSFPFFTQFNEYLHYMEVMLMKPLCKSFVLLPVKCLFTGQKYVCEFVGSHSHGQQPRKL